MKISSADQVQHVSGWVQWDLVMDEEKSLCLSPLYAAQLSPVIMFILIQHWASPPSLSREGDMQQQQGEERLKMLWKSDSWATPCYCMFGLRGIYKGPSNTNFLIIPCAHQSKPEPQCSLSDTAIHTEGLLHPNVFEMRERLSLHLEAETWAQPVKYNDLGVSVYIIYKYWEGIPVHIAT